MIRQHKQYGFTLIELVIVITLAGIVGTIVASATTSQVFGYQQLSNRSALTAEASVALQQLAQDLRNAVPNSIRVSGQYIEFVPVEMVAPYRAEYSDVASDRLELYAADASFDVFDDLVSTNQYYADAQAIIYNIGLTSAGTPVLGANLYAANPSSDPHVISAPGLTIVDNGSEDRIQLDSSHRFIQSSPNRKVYIARGASTYHCNPNSAGGTLRRYSGYTIQQAQPTNAAAAPLTGANNTLLSNRVTACQFRYQIGANQRNGVAVLQLSLSADGETIQLAQQIQVTNVP